eukprot:365600-Chlamydomonas_euryale.AAC.6
MDINSCDAMGAQLGCEKQLNAMTDRSRFCHYTDNSAGVMSEMALIVSGPYRCAIPALAIRAILDKTARPRST